MLSKFEMALIREVCKKSTNPEFLKALTDAQAEREYLASAPTYDLERIRARLESQREPAKNWLRMVR